MHPTGPTHAGSSGGRPDRLWSQVDDYLAATVVQEDEILAATRHSAAGTVLPQAAD